MKKNIGLPITARALGLVALPLFSMSLMACGSFLPLSSNEKSAVGADVVSGNDAISVTAATAVQCPSGGSVYTVFVDANGNGIYDTGETLLNSQVVCNGAAGAAGTSGSNGLATLFLLTRITTTADICASLSGLQIDSGLDTNSDGVLESTEITTTSVVCDGATGATGAAGAAGSNGLGVVFSMAPATAAMCPNGGTTIVMALDAAGTGVFATSDPGQQSTTICNGANGTNGTSAPVSAYSPVQAITPCGDTVANKEVLLLLSGGELLGTSSDNSCGKNTRLAFIQDGTYTDTDGSQCVFTIQTSSDGTSRSISWSGQVQQTWAIQ